MDADVKARIEASLLKSEFPDTSIRWIPIELDQCSRAPRRPSEVVGRLVGRPKWADRAPAEFRSGLESMQVTPIATL